MIKSRLSKFVFILLLAVSSWSHAETSFSGVYFFGDSLSDTGNLASVIGDFPAPYYMNRVSNGPVAIETLASNLGLNANASLHLTGAAVGNNYSVAGANAYGAEPIDLPTQILSFQVNHGFVAPADALYVIFIGGNDVRSARDEADLAIARSTVQSAAIEVSNAIQALYQAGARSFMVINSPNIGLIPETNLIAAALNYPELIKRSRKLSQSYRVALHEAVEQLEDNYAIDIVEFDLFKFFNKLVKEAESLGFTNSTDACFRLEAMSFHPDCNYGMNADQFIFFDEIHPTARTHQIVGNAFYETLSKALKQTEIAE